MQINNVPWNCDAVQHTHTPTRPYTDIDVTFDRFWVGGRRGSGSWLG